MGFGILVLIGTIVLVVVAVAAIKRRRESAVPRHPPEDNTQDPDRP